MRTLPRLVLLLAAGGLLGGALLVGQSAKPSGAKMAERAPMHTRASPLRMRFHSSRRSPSESDECRIATASPKWARKRRANIGVSEISGTSISAVLPLSTAARMARDYVKLYRRLLKKPAPNEIGRINGTGAGLTPQIYVNHAAS